MIVKCENENCQTSFNVKDSVVKKEGSRFRCSKCNHVFMIYPPKPASPEPAKSPESVKRRVPAKASEPAKSPESVKPRAPAASEPAKSPESVKRREPAPAQPPESKAEQPVQDDTPATDDISQDIVGIGDSIADRYVQIGTIGKGGMGEVLLAKDTQLKRKVAIKALREDVSGSKEALEFFIREAIITAQLDHPNIVPLYTVKQPEKGQKTVSFVMKLIKGKDLFDIITRARKTYLENPKTDLSPELRLRSRLEYFLKACEGITYAHSKNVIHRDLKPANIMVGDFGEVYVMDWGIAKVLKKSNGGEQQSDGIVGTPSYMSPEQAKGLPGVGVGSDIFSLGAVLYELVTLKPARVGDTSKKMEWAEQGFLNQISHVVPEKKIEPELKAIINKATEIDPEDRYSSVAALAEDVRCYLRGEEVATWPDNRIRKMWRWMNNHRLLSLTLLLSTLLLFLSIGVIGLIQKQFALKSARFREYRFSQLQAQASAQAYKIDIHFLRLEELAVNLANNATYLIENAPPNNERFYWIWEFKDPEKAPPDLEFSKLYQRPVSIEYPVVKLAPDVRKEDAEPVMKRLAPLRHHFKKLLLDSRNSLAPVGEEEARRLLTVHGLPIRWAYIGLEKGVMYSYPGKSTYPDDYDPRVRPWYQLGAKKNAVFWGNPYRDLQGQGLVLPCAAPLYNKKNEFYGVVGMDVTFSDIIQDNLTRPGAVGIIESFLLDEKGRIVVKSSQLDMEAKGITDNSALKLEPFPVRDVVKAINRGESGLAEVKEGKTSSIIVFCQMPSINWYYVEQLETAIILKQDD